MNIHKLPISTHSHVHYIFFLSFFIVFIPTFHWLHSIFKYSPQPLAITIFLEFDKNIKPPSPVPSPSHSSPFSPGLVVLSAMDHLDFSAGKSSRRELQRARPAPLKVHIDSHRIKKPPVVPSQTPPHHQSRPPVITYVVSPKVIHTNPSEFMALVQRLTGLSSSKCSDKYPMSPNNISRSHYIGEHTISLKSPNGQLSRQDSAANNAWGHIEANSWAQRITCPIAISPKKTNRSPEKKKPQVGDLGMVKGTNISTELPGRTSFFPGILSSGQMAFPTITPNFFPPPSDQNPLSFYQDLSPSLRGNKNYMEGNFMTNHSSYFLSPHMITTPTPSLDLFNNSFTFKRES